MAEQEDTQQHPLTPSFQGSNPCTPVRDTDKSVSFFFGNPVK